MPADCVCCDPPWSFDELNPEPCAIFDSPNYYNVPCGFTSGWTGIDSSSDGELYPYWTSTKNHRKIERWRTTPFGTTWYRDPEGNAPYGNEEWTPATYVLMLTPAVQVDATVDWTLALQLVPFGSSFISAVTVATWTKEDWSPYNTQAAASFSLDQDPDSLTYPHAVITNWHIFDHTLTDAQIQTEATNQKVAHFWEEVSSTWYLRRGDKGVGAGVGSLVSIDSGESGSITSPISSYLASLSHGLPSSVTITPSCFQAKQSTPVVRMWPCYYQLQKWTAGYLDVDVCVSGASSWRDDGNYDDGDFVAPASTGFNWYDFWDSGTNIGSPSQAYRVQVRHGGTWYLQVSTASGYDTTEPGTDSSVWVAWSGAWAAGTYSQDDWVSHGASVYVCNVSSTTEEPGTGSDWTVIGNRNILVENTSDTCSGDCVATIYTPKAHAVGENPFVDDEPDVDCLEINVVGATP